MRITKRRKLIPEATLRRNQELQGLYVATLATDTAAEDQDEELL